MAMLPAWHVHLKNGDAIFLTFFHVYLFVFIC